MFQRHKLSHAVLTVIATLSGSLAYAQEAEQPEEVFVQGFRASLAKAAEQKRAADSIQDSIVAEDMGKFPDQNVAESLQRITGVSISRTNGEGSKITVRGFGPAFNTVRVNDRTLATSEGGREFDFQVLPSELIAGADVIKSPTASTEAGSIGAYVNVKTARPLDHKGLQASGSIHEAYSELSGEMDPEFSGVVSDTFADDTIGVLLGVSKKTSHNRIDDYRTNRWHEAYTFPADMQGDVHYQDGSVASVDGFRRPGRAVFEIQNETRERTGVNGVIQWAPNDNWKSTLDVLYTDLSRQALTNAVQIPTQATQYSNVVIDKDQTLMSATITGNNIDLQTRQVGEDATTKAYGFNSVYTDGPLTLAVDLSKSSAKSNPRVNEYIAHATNLNQNNRIINLDYSGGGVLQENSTIDVTDINNIRAHWNGPGHNEIKDDVSELKLDAKYELEKGVLKSAEAGFSYASRSKSNNTFNAWSHPSNVNGSDCAPCGGELAATFKNPEKIFGLVKYNNFLSEEKGTFPRQWMAVKDLNAYIDGVQEIMNRDWYKDANGHWITDTTGQDMNTLTHIGQLGNPGQPWNTDYIDRGASYANDEDTASGYLQANLGGDWGSTPWTGNVGVRYVTTDSVAKGFGQTVTNLKLNPSSNATELRLDVERSAAQELTAKSSDSYVLPSANFSFNVAEGLYLRTAAAKSITRPALSDTGVNQNVAVDNAGTITFTGSNPYLKPYQVNQFDLSLEYYGANDDAYSAALFQKDIASFISTSSTVGVYDGAVDPAVLNAPAYPGKITRVETLKHNRKGGSVTGLELGALHHMDYLLNGFGVQANYTYAESKDKGADPINQPAITEPGSALEGFAKNSYNLTAFYEQNGWQARIAYNWRGNFMHARDGGAETIAATLPVHTDAYGQFDASLSYDISENVTLSAEAINLTNERQLTYVDVRSRVSLIQYTGARYQVGVRAHF